MATLEYLFSIEDFPSTANKKNPESKTKFLELMQIATKEKEIEKILLQFYDDCI